MKKTRRHRYLSLLQFLVVILSVGSASVASAQPQPRVLATVTVSYRDNAGGCGPFDSNPFGYGNPYYCAGLPPGPIHIPAPRGRYRIVRTQVLNPDDAGGVKVWSGDANGGVQYNPGTGPVEFDHLGGEITLYYHDWFTFDNDPSIGSVVEVYSLDTPRLTLTLNRNVSAPSQEPTGSVPERRETIRATVVVEGGNRGDSVEFHGGPLDLLVSGHDHFEPSHQISGEGFGDFKGLDSPSRSCQLGDGNGNENECSVELQVPRFGGKYAIRVRLAADASASDDDEVDVDIRYLIGASLIRLPPHPAYRLTGSFGNNCAGEPIESRHVLNHYVTFRYALQLERLASAFFDYSGGVQLRINDTSLPKGGVFDIRNRWASDEHAAHREGVNVDIELSGELDGQCFPLNRALQNTLVRLAFMVMGKTPSPENDRNHFHFNRPSR